jgi:hypothetical protein
MYHSSAETQERVGSSLLVLQYAFGFVVAIIVAAITLWACRGIYFPLHYLASLST